MSAKNSSEADASIRPFRIAIPDEQLDDLRDRLARSRLPNELDNSKWELGTPLTDVQRLTKYWATDFDWRRAEASLNEFPQFETDIAAEGFESLKIHFIHKRSSVPGAIPLIFVHGWPGCFYEGTKIIEPLTNPPRDKDGKGDLPAFHVVVPSLPNFGFSEGTSKRGFSVDQHAEILNQLMLRLGYDEYVAQGGDWGFFVIRAMGRRYSPRHLKAQHLNLDGYAMPSLLKNPFLALRSYAKLLWLSPREREGIRNTKVFQATGSSYASLHGTRPQTIAYALTDSPAALLAWVYEKLVTWTDAYPWTDDEVCTWMSIYWFAAAGPGASVRLYKEFSLSGVTPQAEVTSGNAATPVYHSNSTELREWQDCKLGFGHFPKDVISLPGVWGYGMGRVIYEKEHDGGGHFAAWEKPDYVVADLREMFGPKGGARDAVKNTKKD
ncbi:microsomal epoxide hydrolase [Biscogniauxia sp. FL1348]|nr:microsomal epoxide hydrolase [Biscogniauxia sp. FL1348]